MCTMTSSNGSIFRVTCLLWRESTGHRWIPLTKANDAELWLFIWTAPEQGVAQQWRRWWFKTPSHSLWLYCNGQWTGSSRLHGIIIWINDEKCVWHYLASLAHNSILISHCCDECRMFQTCIRFSIPSGYTWCVYMHLRPGCLTHPLLVPHTCGSE